MISIPPAPYREAVESNFVESLQEFSYSTPSLSRRIPGFESLPFRILLELDRAEQNQESKLNIFIVEEGHIAGTLQRLDRLQFEVKIRQRIFPIYSSQSLKPQRFGLYTVANQFITCISPEIFDHNYWGSILKSRADICFYSQRTSKSVYGRVRRVDRQDFWVIYYPYEQTAQDVELISNWKTIYGQNIFENDLCKCKVGSEIYFGVVIVRSDTWYFITANYQVFKINSSFEFQEVYDSFDFDFEGIQ